MSSVQGKYDRVIRQLFEDNSLGKVANIKTITGFGSANLIYHVNTSTDQFVVRLNHDENANQYLKEAWCIEKAREIALPRRRQLREFGLQTSTFSMNNTFQISTIGYSFIFGQISMRVNQK